MAPPALQLFPPPPPNQRRPIQQWPQRSASRATTVKVSIPEPTAERRDSAKSQLDFHELVIRVDSAPSSPAAPLGISAVELPKMAHIAPVRTSPQQSNSAFPPPPQLPPRSSSTASQAPGTAISPQGRVRVSPVGTHVVSPVSHRIASPAFSDIVSARSGSPTLVRSNSAATARSPSSPPPMRSMFPQYNPNVSLDQQTYQPTQTSPTHIPMSKISRPPYTPTKYTPHSNLEPSNPNNISLATPYYTPASMLDSLWDATNGQGTPVVQTFTLQMHRHPASREQSNQPQICFGPTASLPFYSLSHTDIPPGPGEEEDDEDDDEHELLIRRHHPTKPTNVPITHLTLSPTPNASSAKGAAASVDPASLITTIYPKLAALTALDIASHSPAATHIAAFDPDATSDAAQRLAEDVLRGTAERECCALVWTRGQSTLSPNHAAITSPGTYALHHPTLGVFPITHEGDSSPGLSPVLGSLPFSQAPGVKRGNNKPTTITLLNPFASSSQSRPDSPSSDSYLARLDFASDSLILNIAALLSFSNSYFIDVVVSTLLAVTLAEEKRLRREMRFELPPSGPGMPYSFSTSAGLNVVEEEKVKRKRLFKFMKGKAENEVQKALKKPSHSSMRRDENNPRSFTSTPNKTLDHDDEAFEMKDFTQSLTALPTVLDAKAKQKVASSDLPGVTKTILTIVRVGVKAVVWVLGITIKIVGGVVVAIVKAVLKKA